MRVFLPWTGAISLAIAGTALAVAQSPAASVQEVKVCDVLTSPAKFDGKKVKIQGEAVAGFDVFHLQDKNCGDDVAAIWLAYPEGTKAKAGPTATLTLQLSKDNPVALAPQSTRIPVALVADKAFTDLDAALSTPLKTKSLCIACRRFSVNAVLIGRVDAVAEPGLKRDAAGKITAVAGFGNLNRYKARLVIEQVVSATPVEVDAHGAAGADSYDAKAGAGDGQAMALEAGKLYPASTEPHERLNAVYGAWGKPGDANGVVVNFGVNNTVTAASEGKGSYTSPDGLQLTATFDPALKGPMLALAMTHIGAHIVDLRQSESSSSPVFLLEADAWKAVLWEAIAFRQKSVVLPGGFLAWSDKWPQGDASGNVSKAIDASVHWTAIR